MKKHAAVIAFLFTAALAGAQSMNDAYLFSQNNYIGTARTVGMGNAVTAVGGDIGTLYFNPAGSAVNSYSQFSVTPGLVITSADAHGTPLSGQTDPYGFEDPNITGHTRFAVPNYGFVMNFKTNRKSHGLKNWTFGFVGHTTNNFLNEVYASGSNYNTSFAGCMAALADGTPSSVFGGDNPYDNTSWRPVAAYNSNMIATYGGMDDRYIGVTEKTDGDVIRLADGLNQRYGWLRTGSKQDLLFNFGFNISDVFYFGANIGITSLSMNSDEYWAEEAMNPKKFAIQYVIGDGQFQETFFDNLRLRYSYNMEGNGAYLKAGFLTTPVAGLRIGAAITTPTVLNIREYYAYDAQTRFLDSTFDGYSKSPEGEWEYDLRTPMRVNAGVAYTFGPIGLVSADYEMCNYGMMHFKSFMSRNDSEFEGVNADISDFMGVSHMLRVGTEIRPMPELAIRAGYNLTTNPEKDDYGKYIKSNRESASFGLGYSSKSSFFADLGFRVNFLPDDYFLAYDDYAYDASGSSILSPEIVNKVTMFDVLLTLGLRF
jgi:hypothetical protein